MKPFYLLVISLLIFATSLKSQTVIVSGECMTGTITLDPIGNVNGRPAYESTGTVDGFSGVQVDVYWLVPDNLWVLAFDGQPYFQNACDTTLPWDTGNAACPWTSVIGQPCTGATPLAITGAGVLSVHIISFTAQIDNKQVIVNWKTASETNNKGFDIQRSPDAINWSNIGFVSGNINSTVERSYQFNDLKPIQGKNFYRLRQVDLDGKFSYSIVVVVNFLQSGFYSISNNPGNGQYRLHIEESADGGRVDFSVIDASGRLIMSKANNGVGDQTIDISNFPSGIYLLRIIKGTNLFTEKLVKF